MTKLEAGEGCAAFTCEGCGRDMIAIGVEDAPTLCARCTVMPGWAGVREVDPSDPGPGPGESGLDPERVLH